MGLIKVFLTEVIKDIAEDVAMDVAAGALDATEKVGEGVKKTADAVGGAIDRTFGNKAERRYTREQKYLSKNPDRTYLIIQKEHVKKNIFRIYDIDENVRYFAKGGQSYENMKIDFKLFDACNRLIGTVKKTALSFRLPMFHEDEPANYAIMIGNQRVAVLKTRLTVSNKDYKIEPYNWIIRGGVLKWDFAVMDNEKEMLHISRRKGYKKPTYILDFSNKQYELIGVMIALILICKEDD